MEKKQYNVVRKNQADLHALLRAVVCGYLLYLAGKLAFASGEDASFPPAARIAVGILFAAGAAAFGVYTWKRFQADRKDAELTPEELAELAKSDDDDDSEDP